MALYGVANLWFRWPVTYPDQSGDPTVFPYLPGVSLLIEKTPEWKTMSAQSASGRERRASMWSAPIWSFKFKFEALRQDAIYAEFAQLLAFFQARQGQFSTFNYFDRFDNVVTSQFFGLGDGATTQFQLVRYINGLSTSVEPVYSLNGAPTIYVNGIATGVALGLNGLVTFPTAPAAGSVLTWSGSFFFVCRFDADKMAFGQPFSNIWDLSELTFVSVKPDRVAA